MLLRDRRGVKFGESLRLGFALRFRRLATGLRPDYARQWVPVVHRLSRSFFANPNTPVARPRQKEVLFNSPGRLLLPNTHVAPNSEIICRRSAQTRHGAGVGGCASHDGSSPWVLAR